MSGLLWSAQLRKIPGKRLKLPATAALSNDPEQNDKGGRQNDIGLSADLLKMTSANLNVGGILSKPDKNTLIFKWNGIDVGTEKAVFDLWVKISLAPNDKFVRFRAGFNNRSTEYTVFYLTAPVIQGIYPENGELKEDRLAIPCFTGRLCLNPIENGILGKKERFQQNRSGHSMQFDAYYNRQNGLYLGCFDGEQNVKRYRYKTDKETGLTWAMVHVPDNMKKVPQIWETPYDTVIRCFQGDWYDAARIYRQWALKQQWSAEGPLLTRKSTPKWFKEIDEWFLWGVQKNRSLMYTPELLKAMKGLNLGIFATYWGKGSYFHNRTPDRFPLPPSTVEYIKLAKQHRFRIVAYIQGICWDIETESFKQEAGFEHAVKNFYGQSLVWDFSKKKKNPNITAIAYPGKVWTRVLGDTVEKMARVAKFDAAYLDSDNHGGTYLNFNPLYNKNSGGGNEYIKANQKMVRELRKRAREYNPEFCFVAESFWEGNIGVLDGILACNNWHRYLKKGEAEAIPLAQAVYHDYTILFSTWLGKRDVENDDSISFIAKFGQALVWGFKPGYNQPANLLTFKNHGTALSTSLKRYHAYAAAKKFLVYGEMLREPKIINKLPEVDFRYWRAWSKTWFNVTYPAVLRSMWKAVDGSLGIVLYNITKEPQHVKIQLTTKELANVSNVKIKSIYPKTLVATAAIQSGYVVVSCSVPARSPVVIQINR
ncbi:MAG: DUF6259 domain-containing protein [Victivallaceae bacterium]|nr:DUF6259 domain-containing protein [Victivallaceae bacterium]